MAVSDHPREPALERAMPADVGSNPTLFEDTDAEVMLRDGSWVWCQITGQRKDRHGRWCVGIRYYPNATIGESGGWYLYDPRRIRRTQVLRPFCGPLCLAPLDARHIGPG
jgi:hypothetical protein